MPRRPSAILVAAALLSVLTARGGSAQAQVFGLGGFSASPTFAWWDPAAEALRGDGSFARMSTGFTAVSSKRLGSVGGPTVGFEGGRMWQSGEMIYGLVGGFDVMKSLGSSLPAFGRIAYERDFAGAVQFQAGTFVADNVFVYGKLGSSAINETWRYGLTPSSLPFSRTDIAVGPDARLGVEWAITDKLSVSVEAGVTRPAWR